MGDEFAVVSIRADMARTFASSMLADTIRHVLNDDECAEWFARSHDRQHTPDDLTDSDRPQNAGGFNVFHMERNR